VKRLFKSKKTAPIILKLFIVISTSSHLSQNHVGMAINDIAAYEGEPIQGVHAIKAYINFKVTELEAWSGGWRKVGMKSHGVVVVTR